MQRSRRLASVEDWRSAYPLTVATLYEMLDGYNGRYIHAKSADERRIEAELRNQTLAMLDSADGF